MYLILRGRAVDTLALTSAKAPQGRCAQEAAYMRFLTRNDMLEPLYRSKGVTEGQFLDIFETSKFRQDSEGES